MFDALSVSESTKKPWTVAVSFAGQAAMIGLAVLVPLVSTEGLPHPLGWVTLPLPPHTFSKPRPTAPTQHTNTVPFQMTHKGLQLPAIIPSRVAMIQDKAEVLTSADTEPGVPGGFGSGIAPGNNLVNSLVAALPSAAPPAISPAKPPAAPEITRVRIGGLVQQGKLISGPRPVYPPLAKAAHVEGTVRLAAVIARNGSVLDLRVVSGHPLLIRAAMEAVQQWVFRPTTLNGDVVEVATDIEVNFVLQK